MKCLTTLVSLGAAACAFTLCHTNLRAQNYPATVLGDNPQAYYQFEESAGATSFQDSSGNHFHGTALDAVIGATFGELGAIGRAVRFDGAGSLLTGINLNPAAGPFTLEALVYNFMPGPNQIFLAQQDGSGLGRSDLLINQGGLFGSFLGGSTTSSTLSPEANRWYHLVMTYNGVGGTDAIRFYVDGAPAGTGTETAESATGNWVIGSHKNRATQFANGYVDEVAFYGYALSDVQIAAHYLAVPEPTTWVLLAVGSMAGFTLLRRRP